MKEPIPQELMRRDAESQARDRYFRRGVPTVVYNRGLTWFVRAADEPAPKNATVEYRYPIDDDHTADIYCYDDHGHRVLLDEDNENEGGK